LFFRVAQEGNGSDRGVIKAVHTDGGGGGGGAVKTYSRSAKWCYSSTEKISAGEKKTKRAWGGLAGGKRYTRL